jgi:hypothetical protein
MARLQCGVARVHHLDGRLQREDVPAHLPRAPRVSCTRIAPGLALPSRHLLSVCLCVSRCLPVCLSVCLCLSLCLSVSGSVSLTLSARLGAAAPASRRPR